MARPCRDGGSVLRAKPGFSPWLAHRGEPTLQSKVVEVIIDDPGLSAKLTERAFLLSSGLRPGHFLKALSFERRKVGSLRASDLIGMPCAGGAKGGLRGRPPLDVPPPEEGKEAIWTPPPLPLDSILSPDKMRCGSFVFWCSYCPSRTGNRRATEPFGRKTMFSSLTRIRQCRMDVSQIEH